MPANNNPPPNTHSDAKISLASALETRVRPTRPTGATSTFPSTDRLARPSDSKLLIKT